MASDAGQKLEAVSNPLSSVLEVSTADRIFAAQETTSDASINAMDDVDFVVRANLLSLSSGHIGPLIEMARLLSIELCGAFFDKQSPAINANQGNP